MILCEFQKFWQIKIQLQMPIKNIMDLHSIFIFNETRHFNKRFTMRR